MYLDATPKRTFLNTALVNIEKGMNSQMEIRDLTCIGCPIGCMMQVSLEGSQVIAVTGNTCIRGEEYAHKELTNPTRIVTSTVPVLKGSIPIISVKTQSDIPKSKIFECMKELKQCTVTAPVKIGDIIKANIAGTGVNIVATKESLLSIQ